MMFLVIRKPGNCPIIEAPGLKGIGLYSTIPGISKMLIYWWSEMEIFLSRNKLE